MLIYFSRRSIYLLAGYMEAKKPPGTWVIRYPQKNDISIATNDPRDQLICIE